MSGFDHKTVDLAVIGAGLAGSALVASLRAQGFSGSILVMEAGRGPGGRTATRRRRCDNGWRLDHGAPCLSFSSEPNNALAALLDPLLTQGVLIADDEPVAGIDQDAQLVNAPEHPLLRRPRWRGQPTMAAVAEALLAAGGPNTQCRFGIRVRHLSRGPDGWEVDGCRARSLVLTGTLLAHPRSLAMLGWQDVPLRTAVPPGDDPALDRALVRIAALQASVRWNLMLELPPVEVQLPRQIWLTPPAQERYQVERLVLQRQGDRRLGLVVHGLDDGTSITPESQPTLLAHQERRLTALLPDLLAAWPDLQAVVAQARALGVMRWGAAQPMAPGLPQELQWCGCSRVGFCGDWIAGPGFAMAEGALQSAVDLAESLQPALLES